MESFAGESPAYFNAAINGSMVVKSVPQSYEPIKGFSSH